MSRTSKQQPLNQDADSGDRETYTAYASCYFPPIPPSLNPVSVTESMGLPEILDGLGIYPERRKGKKPTETEEEQPLPTDPRSTRDKYVNAATQTEATPVVPPVAPSLNEKNPTISKQTQTMSAPSLITRHSHSKDTDGTKKIPAKFALAPATHIGAADSPKGAYKLTPASGPYPVIPLSYLKHKDPKTARKIQALSEPLRVTSKLDTESLDKTRETQAVHVALQPLQLLQNKKRKHQYLTRLLQLR